MPSSLARFIEFAEKQVVVVREEALAVDALGPMEALIENEVSLVSAGTELALLTDVGPDAARKPFPRRPGYACVGRIVRKGDGITDFGVGDRVFYAGKHRSAEIFQHGRDTQWGRLYPVPDDLEPEDAVFVCLAQIASTAPFISEIDLGDTVAVFGMGLIGNFAAQIYQRLGARVLCLDPQPERLELARRCGLRERQAAAPAHQVEAVLEATGGSGAEITVDAVGHSSVVANCIQATRLLGQVVLLGTPRAAVEADLTASFHAIHSRGLVVRGAHMWRFPPFEVRGAKQTVPMAYDRIFSAFRSGDLAVTPLRSHLVPPEEAATVYHGLEHQRDAYWGVVFDWRR